MLKTQNDIGKAIPERVQMMPEKAFTIIKKYFEDGEFERDLSGLIGYKTQSNDKKFQTEAFSYLNIEMVPYLNEMGFKYEIYDNPCEDGGPILVVRGQENSICPTVMTYGHGDVIDGYDGKWTDGIKPWTVTKKMTAGTVAEPLTTRHSIRSILLLWEPF